MIIVHVYYQVISSSSSAKALLTYDTIFITFKKCLAAEDEEVSWKYDLINMTSYLNSEQVRLWPSDKHYVCELWQYLEDFWQLSQSCSLHQQQRWRSWCCHGVDVELEPDRIDFWDGWADVLLSTAADRSNLIAEGRHRHQQTEISCRHDLNRHD